MSGPIGSSQWMYSTGAASFFSHTIDQSLRFNSGDSSYLTFDPSSSTAGTWTVSFWVKRCAIGVTQYIYYSGAVNARGGFYFLSDNRFGVSPFNSSGANMNRFSVPVFRDPAAWYHIVITANGITTSNLSTNLIIYVNGVAITTTQTSQSSPTGGDRINDAQAKRISGLSPSGGQHFDGMLAEWHWIDGTVYDVSNFGEFKDSIWTPKEVTGLSYGQAGYYLNFADNSDIGNNALTTDGSNDWTPSGLASTDVVLDSPTNNFATLNPLYHSAAGAGFTLSEGNLKGRGNSGGFNSSANGYNGVSTFAIPKDKKIYIEVECPAQDGANFTAGFASVSGLESGPSTTNVGGSNSITVYNRQVYINGNEHDYGGPGLGNLGVQKLAAGDILGCMCDGATGKVWFSRNGTYFQSPSGTTGDPTGGNHEIGTITNGATEDIFFVAMAGNTTEIFVNFGQDSVNVASAQSDENGIGTFEYAPPTDYVALCSSNLSDPTIGPGQTEQADDNFNTVLYTGNGFPTSGTQSITGVGFQPDWVWIKNRDRSGYNNFLFDSVRGATKALKSNIANAENTESTALTSFDSDGFTLGANNEVNYQNDSIVSWNWKAGGSASSNSNGTITSSVSANQDAGFSIVSWTGTGSAGTIGHGLSSAPEHIIVKNRDSTAGRIWLNYVKAAVSDAETDYLSLQSTGAATDNADVWNDTAPTSTVFSVGSNASANEGSDKMIAYCFHSVEGYSKFGSFQGNDANFPNGTFVWTGFRPALVVLKASNTNGDWVVTDNKRASSFNGDTARLYWSQNYAETAHNSNRNIELFSNGFKVHGNSASSESNRINENASYIYLAFAEAPLKFANAR